MSEYNNEQRFQIFKVTKHDLEVELMQKSRAHHGEPRPEAAIGATKPFASSLSNKVVMDAESDRKFVISAEYYTYEDEGATHTVSSSYPVWEIAEDKAVLLEPSEAAAALNINPLELMGVAKAPLDASDARATLDPIRDVLDADNIYRLMDLNSRRLAQMAGDYPKDSPDSRTRLKNHAVLEEKLKAYKDENLEGVKAATEAFQENIRDYELGLKTDPRELDELAGEFERVVEIHKDNIMLASLEPSNFLVVNNNLLEPKAANDFTELSFSAVRPGQFMELGDVEGRLLVGIASSETADRIRGELGDTPLDDTLIRLITLKEKGDNTITSLYIVEDIDRHLWLRADQTNGQGDVISRNEESLVAIGINPDMLTQGASSEYGLNKGEAVRMRRPLTANHLRRLATEEQIKEHKALAVKPYPKPEQRQPTTRVQKHIDSNFVIERLDDKKAEEFSLWGLPTNDSEALDEVVHTKSLWRIVDRRSGDITLLADTAPHDSNKDPDANKIILKYMNKHGEVTTGNNWINGFSFDGSQGVSANSIKEGLESISRFDEWEDPNSRAMFEALIKGNYGLEKSKYPYYGDEEDLDETKLVEYGKRRKNSVKH